MVQRGTGRLPSIQRDRGRRIADRVAEVVKAYVSVNLLLAIAAGVLTWGFLEAEGFHLAVPLAVLVAFLDLIPLIGLTVGGFSVFIVLLIDGGPGDAIVWLAIFLVYQQLQDRIIQPLLYKGGALKVNPAVAIVAVIVGANLAGVLGALLAIPTAASLGVVIDELVFYRFRRRPADGRGLSRPSSSPPRFQKGLPRSAGKALLRSLLLALAVEEPAPRPNEASRGGRRSRFRRPEPGCSRSPFRTSPSLHSTRARMTPRGRSLRRRPGSRPRPWSSRRSSERRLISSTPETAEAMITASTDFRPSFSQ